MLLIHLDSLMKVVEAEISDGVDLAVIPEVVMQSERLFEFKGFEKDVQFVEPLFLLSIFKVVLIQIELSPFHRKGLAVGLSTNSKDLNLECVVYICPRRPVVVLVRSSFLYFVNFLVARRIISYVFNRINHMSVNLNFIYI